MSALEPPDTFHVAAAIGWLELGNATEAGLEIAKINPALWEHPDVLEVRWRVCSSLETWERALEVGEALVRIAPEKEVGWLHRAYALRRAKGGGIEKAWEALRPAFDRFPQVALIPYNLACYAAQLGQLENSWEWFQKALRAADDLQAMKEMALADLDLEQLWERIRNM